VDFGGTAYWMTTVASMIKTIPMKKEIPSSGILIMIIKWRKYESTQDVQVHQTHGAPAG
jgi:hypothetical protein